MIPTLPKLRVATVARVSTARALSPSILLAIPVAAAHRPMRAPSRSRCFRGCRCPGSYLAARHAGIERDAAAAALYYRAALRGDPRNTELLDRAFLALLANGEFEDAVRLAERVLQTDKNDRIARLVLGVRAIKQKQYTTARQQLAQSVRGPITDLAATLLSAWTNIGLNDSKVAIDAIDKLAGPEWYALFKDLHAGLILDLSGHRSDALKRLERAYKLDPTALRVAQAYASQLARLGNREEALKVYRTLRQVAAAASAGHRRHQGSRSRTAPAADRRYRRRPAPPKCSTASARRSGGAAARTSASSICSSRSISRRTTRWRWRRSRISTRR